MKEGYIHRTTFNVCMHGVGDARRIHFLYHTRFICIHPYLDLVAGLGRGVVHGARLEAVLQEEQLLVCGTMWVDALVKSFQSVRPGSSASAKHAAGRQPKAGRHPMREDGPSCSAPGSAMGTSWPVGQGGVDDADAAAMAWG